MAPFRLLKKTLARRRRVCLSLSGISMHQSTARGNTGRGRPGGRVLVRVRVITLAFSVLRRPLTPAAAELKGLHDEPCHRQEHLESQRQRSRRLWRRRARAREHASTREGSRWAPCGPASPSGLPSRPEAPRRHQGPACYGGRSTLLVHGQQRAPHESVGPLGPLLLEHLPD